MVEPAVVVVEGVDDGERSDLEVARVFGDVARALLAEDSVQHTLDRIVELAVDTIVGCDFAAISWIERRTIDTRASTGDVPRRVDAIQYEVDQGPCLDAIKDHEVIQVNDLSQERRWPAFSRRTVEEVKIMSMLSFRLFAEEDTMGALNLYSFDVNGFEDEATDIGSVFAAHAAVAIVGARQHEQMAKALETRDVIGQAKGIIMEREHVSDAEAFDRLRRASQRVNLKLAEVAHRVTRTGEAPEDL